MAAHFLEQVQQVRTDDDGRAVARFLHDEILRAADRERVEARERLVEKHHARLVQEAACKRDLLLHAAREFGGQHVRLVGHFEGVEQLAAALRDVAQLVKPPGEFEVLADGEVVEEPRLVGEKCEELFCFERIIAQIVPPDFYAPMGRGDDARDAAQRGRLARAVRPDEAHHFSRLHAEREVADRGDVAVEFGEAFDCDHVPRIVSDGAGVRQARCGKQCSVLSCQSEHGSN